MFLKFKLLKIKANFHFGALSCWLFLFKVCFIYVTACLNKSEIGVKLGLHIVVTVAEHACDDASKRILKLYELQIFLVKHQYL